MVDIVSVSGHLCTVPICGTLCGGCEITGPSYDMLRRAAAARLREVPPARVQLVWNTKVLTDRTVPELLAAPATARIVTAMPRRASISNCGPCDKSCARRVLSQWAGHVAEVRDWCPVLVDSSSSGEPPDLPDPEDSESDSDHAEVPEPSSAAQPASPDDYIPTALRGTPLGSVLLERMASECWHPIILDDVPRKWLPVLQRRPPKFEDGRLNGSTMCGTIALTMPDEPVCRIYKQWFEMLPPTAKLNIATCMESTQSFIEAYGPETYNRTLLNLAVHGKPQAIFVEACP